MNETFAGNRNSGWKWAAIALLALIAVMATCIFSAVWGGLFGYAIGRGSAQRAEVPGYSYEEPMMPFEPEMPSEPGMPFDLDSRAWLGVGFMTGEDGALVTSVISGSPAEAAGIRVEDTIIEVDGKPVTPDYPLNEHILGYNPGDRVEITLLRNGRERVVSVRLASRSDSGLPWYDDSFPLPVPELYDPDVEG